jgi:hypothetical protein
MRGESEGPTDAEIAAALSRQSKDKGGFQRSEKSSQTDHVGGENQGTETGFGINRGLNQDYKNVFSRVTGPTRRGEPVGKIPTYEQYFRDKEAEAAELGHESEGYAAGILGKSDPEKVRELDTEVEDINRRVASGDPLNEDTVQRFVDKVGRIVDGKDDESSEQDQQK